MYERIIKIRSTDLEAIPGLIIACSQFDPSLAEKYDAKLPRASAELDAEALENLAAPRLATAAKVEEVKEVAKPEEEKKKKRRKRKKPRKHDTSKPLDPERWKPMKERSYFKRKRGRGIEKGGSQGAGERKPINQATPPPAQPTPAKTTTTSTCRVVKLPWAISIQNFTNSSQPYSQISLHI